MEPRASEESSENTCVVCYKGVEIYSIGQCDHPVCYECSSRMRVLCFQNECPICRQDMPTVIFTEKIRLFKKPKVSQNLKDDKFKIVFDSEKVKKAYEDLLAHTCPKCNGKSFPTFIALKDHAKRAHQLNFCDLCVEHLKILTRERRCYTRQELGQHRRQGDPDDRSHRGHPLCQFCDTRFMDNDELYRHLRRNHLFCHFCDADGYDHYYSTYDFLREHFRTEHFLCEEGKCYDEKFTAVFRTEIDLKAHRASVHGKAIGKAAVKQTRTLELEFTLAPRARASRNNRNRQEEEMELGAVGGTEEPVVFTQLKTDCMEEFPTLGGKGGMSQPTNPLPHQSKVTIRSSTRGFMMTDENFPALGPEATVSLQVNSERPISSLVNTKQPKLSIHVNHRPSGFTTKFSSSAPRLRDQDFPALSGKAASSAKNIASTQWSSSKKQEPKVTLIKQTSDLPTRQSHQQPKSFTMENDFPSLSSQFSSSCSFEKDNKVNKNNSAMTNTIGHSSDSDSGPLISNRTKKKKSKPKSASSSSVGNAKKQVSGKGNEDCDTSKRKKEKQVSKAQNPAKNSECVNNNTLLDNNNTVKEENRVVDANAAILKTLQENKSSNDHLNGQKPPVKVFNGEEFPILGRSRPPGFSDAVRVPPGFNSLPKWEVSKPPPGLEGVKAPPGFEAGFNLANGCFPPLVEYNDYVLPQDFAKRNTALISKVVKVIGRDRLDAFKEMSVSYRNGIISGEEYYTNCEDTIGSEAFQELFPELLALLPDIKKQQELWPIYTMRRDKENNRKNKLEACATCGQVVKSGDLREHLTSHALENHFPVLNGVIPPGLSKAWSNK